MQIIFQIFQFHPLAEFDFSWGISCWQGWAVRGCCPNSFSLVPRQAGAKVFKFLNDSFPRMAVHHCERPADRSKPQLACGEHPPGPERCKRWDWPQQQRSPIHPTRSSPPRKDSSIWRAHAESPSAPSWENTPISGPLCPITRALGQQLFPLDFYRDKKWRLTSGSLGSPTNMLWGTKTMIITDICKVLWNSPRIFMFAAWNSKDSLVM